MDEDQLDEVQENAEDAEDAQAQGDTEDAEDAQAQGDTGNAAPQAIPVSPTVGPRVAAPKRPSLADWQPAKDAPGYFNDLQDTPPASAKSSSLWKTAGNAAWVAEIGRASCRERV